MIKLSASRRRELQRIVDRPSEAAGLVRRARVVLLSADGIGGREIAVRLTPDADGKPHRLSIAAEGFRPFEMSFTKGDAPSGTITLERQFATDPGVTASPVRGAAAEEPTAASSSPGEDGEAKRRREKRSSTSRPREKKRDRESGRLPPDRGKFKAPILD